MERFISGVQLRLFYDNPIRELLIMQTLTWIGIAFCISQSAMFSGLNLAFFSVTRLSLEVEASTGNNSAKKSLR